MKNDLAGRCCHLLASEYPGWKKSAVTVEPFQPDGSLRQFYRLHGPDNATLIAIVPAAGDQAGFQEAGSAWKIGSHLAGVGSPVPQMYVFDQHSGLLLCEDLGNTRLHDLITENTCINSKVRSLYREAVIALTRMQVHGAEGFDPAWCWDTPKYDRQLMVERESDYFLQALCRDFLHLTFDEQVVRKECRILASQAAKAPSCYFLHRDFQSRNIMVKDDRVRFIDFQGARFGPFAYDLASLLIDPYAALTQDFQQELIVLYLDALNDLIHYDRQQFHHEYIVLAMQRNLQILGAFAFLSQQRGKMFFRQFIGPALYSLQSLLAKPETGGYSPALQKVTEQCCSIFDELVKTF